MVMMVDMMGDMMGDMMVIMEMVPGDWRRDAPGGVDDVEQRRRERPVRASQRGAGRLHRGGQEPHHQHREEAVEEVEAEEGDDPEDDGGLAQPDEEVVLHKIQNTKYKIQKKTGRAALSWRTWPPSRSATAVGSMCLIDN